MPGGLAAGICFLLPSVFILLGLSYVYAAYGTVTWIAALFYGLKPAVLAIVASATLRLGAKALRHPLMYGLAAAAFIALFFFKVPFPLVIAGSAAAGFLGVRFLPQVFAGRASAADEQAYAISDNSVRAEHTRPSFKRAVRVSGVCLLLWAIPLFLLGWWQAWHHVFFQEALFFSKAAMVTFGGGIAPSMRYSRKRASVLLIITGRWSPSEPGRRLTGSCVTSVTMDSTWDFLQVSPLAR